MRESQGERWTAVLRGCSAGRKARSAEGTSGHMRPDETGSRLQPGMLLLLFFVPGQLGRKYFNMASTAVYAVLAVLRHIVLCLALESKIQAIC